MASRFWTQGYSDTDIEDSDYGEEVDTGEAATTAVVRNIYLHVNSIDTNDSNEEKHVVKSAKDKRYEKMSITIDHMKNAIKIKDWITLQENFGKLNKQLEKMMRRYMEYDEKVSILYVKALVMLEDFLTRDFGNKYVKIRMSSSNAKAMNCMIQKVKKTKKKHEDLISKYREDSESDCEGELRGYEMLSKGLLTHIKPLDEKVNSTKHANEIR